jgi:predicted Zn-dependent protease
MTFASMTHFLRISLAAMMLFTSSPVLLAQNIALPDIGDSGATVLTPEQERRTGQAIIRNIRRAGGILDDPLVTEYINQVGYKLVSHSQANHSDFAFFVINDPEINAFALPGGFIGINYGLILSSQSESELASVIAHEIAHVTQRHHARAYEMASENNIPVMAALIAAIVLGSNNSEVGEAAMASLAAGTVQRQIDFTRENEKEADHIGIALLSDAGFDPFSMGDFFDTLHRRSRLHGPQAPEFLRTHPVNENRVADAKNRASQYPRAQLKNEFDFHLVKTRLQAISDTQPARLLETFKNNLESGRYANKTAEQYGYVLALAENGQYNKAEHILKQLLAKNPQRIAYLLAHAELKKRAGESQQALSIYKSALMLYPKNEALTLPYAETLLEMKRAQKAIQVLGPLLHEPDTYPHVYQLLAQAEGQLQHEANKHEAMAEFYFHNGQIHQAITQLELALKDSSADFYQRSRVEARLKTFKEELINARSEPS